MKRNLSLLLPCVLFLCSGCMRPGVARCGPATAGDALAATYDMMVALNDLSSPPPDPDPPVTVVEYVPAPPRPPTTYLPPAAPPPPGPRTFDLGAAQSVLSQVDPATCKAYGFAPGYAHAVVAFAPDGSVSGVALDLPQASSPAARACLEAAFRDARVPAFSGSRPMNARRTFYVS